MDDLTNWRKLDPRAHPDMLGLIPLFILDNDPRPARQQIHERYAHGGGWFPLREFKRPNTDSFVLKYPGDPALTPLFSFQLPRETIIVYANAFVAIFQTDGSFEVGRID